MFFWEFPRRLKYKGRRFGTQYQFHRPGRSGIKGEEERRVIYRIGDKLAYLLFYILPSFLLHHLFLIVQDGGTDIEFRNVGFYTSDAGEIPKRTLDYI